MAEYTVRSATCDDIPAIAALFVEAFRESVLHHCGQIPKLTAMEDVFSLVLRTEPGAAFVACDRSGGLVGYCFAPTCLYRIWVKAIFDGDLFVWGYRWLTGKYGFGLRPVKVIFSNKLFFLRSALTPGKAARARILSIAVSEQARNHGIAGMLMDTACDWFTRCGIKRVRLEVRPDNVPAIRVYEKHRFYMDGYTEDLQGKWLIMYRE